MTPSASTTQVEPQSSETGSGTRRVAIIYNMPAPYRTPIFEKIAVAPGIDLMVFFCSTIEPDRDWKVDDGAYRRKFFKERFFTFRGKYIHANTDTWRCLSQYRPDVVITTGFNPTFLIGFLYARWNRVKHIAMTDGTFDSEQTLSAVHRFVRRVVYPRSQAFIAASDGGFKLYDHYGVSATRMFKAMLCVDNDRFAASASSAKAYDFVFSGRFVAIKNPSFAFDVAARTATLLGRRTRILFVGAGELEASMRAQAAQLKDVTDTTFWGFASQAELPSVYASARILLFPTLWDPWGVVANEACAVGLPVLVSPHAGCAGELVRDGENGYVLPLDADAWAHAAARLLGESSHYAQMSTASMTRVRQFNFDDAAAGVVAAIRSV